MNQTIETILNHRSVRDFTDQALSKEQVETLVRCAQSAATSSFLQAYSIIGVTDREKKEALAKLAFNQDYVVNNGHFFVFCADLNRHETAADMESLSSEQKEAIQTSLESTEKFMVSLIDAALAAQNMAVAAESMGLGICYIGAVRNHLEEVSEILGVPEKVVPLFGMAIGYPAKVNDQKPRLPIQNIYHENTYQPDNTVFQEQLSQYNAIIEDYYATRTAGERQERWTEQISRMLSRPNRMYMKEFVQEKRLDTK